METGGSGTAGGTCWSNKEIKYEGGPKEDRVGGCRKKLKNGALGMAVREKKNMGERLLGKKPKKEEGKKTKGGKNQGTSNLVKAGKRNVTAERKTKKK